MWVIPEPSIRGMTYVKYYKQHQLNHLIIAKEEEMLNVMIMEIKSYTYSVGLQI